MKFLRLLTEGLLLLFIFLLPWQTKLIIFAANNNFNEISLYGSHLVLSLALISFFVYQIRKKREEERVPKIWYFLGIIEVCFFISFFFASDKILATYHFALLILGLALFYILREGLSPAFYADNIFNRRRAIYAFLISTFFHASLGIYQFFTQSTFANKYLGLAKHDPQVLGSAVIETVSGRWLRAYGGLDHPNILGGVLVFSLLLSVFILASKKIINSRIQIYGLLLLFVNYFVSLLALFFTFSRASWLAFFVGLVVLAITFFRKEDKWIKGRFLTLLLFSLVFFALVFFPYKDLALTRIKAETRLEVISTTERKEQLMEVKNIIQKNPIFGVGTGNYVTHLETEEIGNNSYVQPVHNSLLLFLAETGLVSFLALMFFFFFLVRDGRRENFSLALAVSLLVLMLFEHWFFSLPFGIIFFFFILGII
jgi:O-antigen ligase